METGKLFEIEGYYLDEPEETIDGYLVYEFDEEPTSLNVDDDDIFFYGMGEDALKQAIEAGEKGSVDFVITSYKDVTASYI